MRPILSGTELSRRPATPYLQLEGQAAEDVGQQPFSPVFSFSSADMLKNVAMKEPGERSGNATKHLRDGHVKPSAVAA